MKLHTNDTFNKELPADAKLGNHPRQVFNSCFSFVTPRVPGHPSILHATKEVAELLGISEDDLNSKDFLNFVSGAEVWPKTHPYSMCYGGHQFGNWAGQLGDGRAINLTEIFHENQRWAIQLKGAGRTPYSRTADGLAVLRSSIREHLCSEAMFHLGVPTTRSLSIALTGDEVLRDILYNGNPAMEKGAVVARVAPSFIRFGNFEIFASRSDFETQKKLVDYTINHFYPEIEAGTKEGYLQLFKTVTQRTLEMIVHWQRVGFVHGVMNTDNMSILGLTIDYGPYGWLEGYDPDWTPNTTDREHRRYRFGHQPQVAMWNLYQLANALYSLVDNEEALQNALNDFNTHYNSAYIQMMRNKLGLKNETDKDRVLITSLEDILQLSETDITIFFRNLSNFKYQKDLSHSASDLDFIIEAFYAPHEIKGDILNQWLDWLSMYQIRLQQESISAEERKKLMNSVNPKYVLRNYMAQMVIDEADKGNYDLLHSVHQLLKRPYDEQPENEKWFTKRPEWARHKVGCSMLSCSS